MSSKDSVMAATTVSKSTQGTVTAKQRATPTVKNQGTKSLAAQVKMQVPDKLSMVREVEESEVDININSTDAVYLDKSYGSKNVSDNSLDIYVPHGPDDTNVDAIAAIYASADNDDHSDDDKYAEEDAKNAELEDDYEEEELIFLIPVHDQWEQEATICHAMSFDASAEQAILSIQTVIGSAKMPMDKCPPPVVKIAKTGSLKVSLHNTQDWEKIKALWEAEYMKKQVSYDINVVMTKKMMRDIEEAVKRYMNNGKKAKPPGKAAKRKNPYLSAESSDDGHGVGDGHDLNSKSNDEYRAKVQLLVQLLMQHWPCNMHTGKVCLGDKTKGSIFL
ncbi:hypothetical protein K439DRAFT_1618470 [Ramaria rubella]|nr:hypothetical protein K439DRAFT_1618470 [Ramaria rubella]